MYTLSSSGKQVYWCTTGSRTQLPFQTELKELTGTLSVTGALRDSRIGFRIV